MKSEPRDPRRNESKQKNFLGCSGKLLEQKQRVNVGLN